MYLGEKECLPPSTRFRPYTAVQSFFTKGKNLWLSGHRFLDIIDIIIDILVMNLRLSGLILKGRRQANTEYTCSSKSTPLLYAMGKNGKMKLQKIKMQNWPECPNGVNLKSIILWILNPNAYLHFCEFWTWSTRSLIYESRFNNKMQKELMLCTK